MFRTYYEKLLSHNYAIEKDGVAKQIWEWIREKELTACPFFVGNKYEISPLRLMVVGRAVNGWDVDTAQCSSLESTIIMVLHQNARFEDVVNPNGIPYFDSETKETKVYHYSTSRFWRLIQYILEEAGEGEDFHQRIVWSNVYKVAPYVTGNPAWSLVKPNMQTYIDCLIEEIRINKPTHILFVTGMDYLNPWEKEPQFGEQLGIGKKNQTKFEDCQYECGVFEGAKIVVCGRPENKSYDNIREMAKEILNKFDTIRP